MTSGAKPAFLQPPAPSQMIIPRRAAYPIYHGNVGVPLSRLVGCWPTEYCSTDLPGLLLNSLRDASSRNSSTAQHKKMDSPQFTFHGRSYGVASAVGLLGSPSINGLVNRQNPPKTIQYSFSESGYNSVAKCSYNDSSDLRFEALQLIQGQGSEDGSPFTGSVAVLQAVGSLPTGEWQGFTTMSIAGNHTAVALASVSNETAYFCGFLGGIYYSYLNKVQCEVTFTPTLFNVVIDMLAQNISVSPTSNDQYDIDGTGGLIDNVFMGVSFVSQTLTTMYTGLLGNAFFLNIDAVRDREGHPNVTKADITTGLAESLERLFDDYFGAVGASQLLIYNQSHTVDSTMQVQVIQLGQPVYAYVTWAINLAILAFLGFEAWRTKLWKSLPFFNCLDAKSVIIGIAASDGRGSTQGDVNQDQASAEIGK